MGMKLTSFCLCLLMAGCMKKLPMPSPKNLSESPKSDVVTVSSKSIYRDGFGVPYINGSTLLEAVYGLGKMHARDRLFQLDGVRLLAQGRSSELFGKATLEFDYVNRLLTYKLAEQEAMLNDEERAIIKAYIQGINDEAHRIGPSTEHLLLMRRFEDFSVQDVIAIGRFQSWYLAQDLYSELAKLNVLRSSLPSSIKELLIGPVENHGAAIIKATEKAPLPSAPLHESSSSTSPSAVSPPFDILPNGSNAWAVGKEFTDEKEAILMNDPHLRHAWPSNFYMAALFINENLLALGASFVGLPAILIGSGEQVSFGVTASYVNTQDLVTVPSQNNADLRPWPQKFVFNNKGDYEEKTFEISSLGPIMSKATHAWLSENEKYAIQWTGFLVDRHVSMFGDFVKLARSPSAKEAQSVIQTMTFPGVNLIFADTLGNVGYAYAGLIPVRDPSQHPYVPLDGAKKGSLWTSFVAKKPTVINPKNGFLVTANQNIFEKSTPDASFGQQGANPSRAISLHNKIADEILEKKRVSKGFLQAMQLDSVDIEAKAFSPYLGALCKKQFADEDPSRKYFAELLADFDGNFSTDSLAALPYHVMSEAIIKDLFSSVQGRPANGFKWQSSMAYLLKDTLARHQKGQVTPFSQALTTSMDTSCNHAYDKLVRKYGDKPSDWRWGNHHYLERQSSLAKVPLLRRRFKDKKREVAGHAHAPMAEHGLPVIYGANLRFSAVMSTPPKLEMILDSGNSGHITSPHAFDQAKLWHEGKTIVLEPDFKKVKSQFLVVD